jgi:tetratricopeptide (TPR) repeat protein
MSRVSVISLAIAVAFGSAGCDHLSSCERHSQAQEAKKLAKIAYDGGHYDQAKELYNNAVEWCEENYDARMGLANASRMLGNQLYQVADQNASVGKLPQAQKIFQQANENHSMADRLLRTAIVEKPEDLEPHYSLGLLWYDRATSPISAPYRPDDVEDRQRERDEAIKEFTLVLAHNPSSSQSLRYRGLAYLSAGRLEEGARDLKIFHDSRQDLYNKIVNTWPAQSDADKKRKEIALRDVEKEIDDVREVLVLELGELVTRAKALKRKETHTPQEDQEMGHLTTEQILLEGMIKSFALTNMGEVEQTVVKRCREYLESFNRGNLSEVLSFLGARKGEEKQLRDGVSQKVAKGTQFKKVVFRTAEVAGERATIGFVCDLVVAQSSHPDTEVTIRWRLNGGQWLVTDHP